MGCQATRVLQLDQAWYHWQTLDNHSNQKTMGDLLEYVGATQRRSEQPEITRITSRTCSAGCPYHY
jgi:hypothetical protein